MSNVAETNFAFVNDNLDSYLDVLADLYDEPPRACANRLVPPELNPSARKRVRTDSSASFVFKEFVGPEYISCFDKSIELSSSSTESKKAKFFRLPKNESNVAALSRLRFPNDLKSCYGKNADVRVDEAKEVKKSPVELKRKRRSRRTRYSLLQNELNAEDTREVVPQIPTDSDIRDLYDNVFPIRSIPFIYGCRGEGGNDCAASCSSQARCFELFMEVKFVAGRPMPPLVRENLSKIQNESGAIDSLSALIASSAIGGKAAKRVFVPVSYDLGDKIGISDKLATTPCLNDVVHDVDADVIQVMVDILQFIDRQSEFVDFGYDPDCSFDTIKTEIDEIKTDLAQIVVSPTKKRRKKSKILRELAKLTNISITDESAELGDEESQCPQLTCTYGCICGSINAKNHQQEHCRNVECMFECTCSVKYYFVNEGELAKHEKHWHQTVVRKKNNDVEITGIERKRRATKFPARFEDALVGLQMDRRFKSHCDDVEEGRKSRRRMSNETDENKQKSATESKPSLKSSAMKQALNKFTKAVYDKRYTSLNGEDAKTLDFVFIWCSIHNKYDCYCFSWVSSTKTNNLILKPMRLNRFSAQKCMEQINLAAKSSSAKQVLFYDHETNSARTQGCWVDYRKRNNTAIYRELHSRLLQYDVLSFSNGFLKGSPVATVATEELLDDYPFSGMRGVGEIVRVFSTDERLTVDVGGCEIVYDEGQEVAVSSVTIDLNDAMEYHPKPSKLKEKPTFQPCFSLYKKKKNLQKMVCKSKKAEQDSDSDIEIVENNCEIVSLSSEDEESVNESVTIIEEDFSSDNAINETVKDKTVSDFNYDNTSATRLFEDKDVYAVQNDPPAKRARVEVTPMSSESGNFTIDIEATTAGFHDEVAGTQTKMSPIKAVPDLNKDVSVNLDVAPHHPPTEASSNDGYPDFGLFCMAHPEVGYFPVIACADGSVGVTVEDPLNTKTLRIFKNFEEANNYVKCLVKVYYDPNFTFAPNAKFVKVTKGVLMKFKSEKFIERVKKTVAAPLKKKKPKSTGTAAQKQSRNDKKVIKKPFELKSSLNSSVGPDAKSCKDTPTKKPFELKSSLNSSVGPYAKSCKDTPTSSTTPTPTAVALAPTSSMTPTAEVKKIVGTFKTMNEAATFIEKKYATQVVLKPQMPQAVAERQGMRLMSVMTEGGWRTVLMRGPVPASLAGKVRPMLLRSTPTNSGLIKLSPEQFIDKTNVVPNLVQVSSVNGPTSSGVAALTTTKTTQVTSSGDSTSVAHTATKNLPTTYVVKRTTLAGSSEIKTALVGCPRMAVPSAAQVIVGGSSASPRTVIVTTPSQTSNFLPSRKVSFVTIKPRPSTFSSPSATLKTSTVAYRLSAPSTAAVASLNSGTLTLPKAAVNQIKSSSSTSLPRAASAAVPPLKTPTTTATSCTSPTITTSSLPTAPSTYSMKITSSEAVSVPNTLSTSAPCTSSSEAVPPSYIPDTRSETAPQHRFSTMSETVLPLNVPATAPSTSSTTSASSKTVSPTLETTSEAGPHQPSSAISEIVSPTLETTSETGPQQPCSSMSEEDWPANAPSSTTPSTSSTTSTSSKTVSSTLETTSEAGPHQPSSTTSEMVSPTLETTSEMSPQQPSSSESSLNFTAPGSTASTTPHPSVKVYPSKGFIRKKTVSSKMTSLLTLVPPKDFSS